MSVVLKVCPYDKSDIQKSYEVFFNRLPQIEPVKYKALIEEDYELTVSVKDVGGSWDVLTHVRESANNREMFRLINNRILVPTKVIMLADDFLQRYFLWLPSGEHLQLQSDYYLNSTNQRRTYMVANTGSFLEDMGAMLLEYVQFDPKRPHKEFTEYVLEILAPFGLKKLSLKD